MLLDRLFSFLEPNSVGTEAGSLNLTLSGYFSKVMLTLMNQRPKEMVKYVIHTDGAVFDKLLAHIDNKSICEIFIKMLNELSEGNKGGLPGLPDI
jgi:hypothetical protein